MSKGKVVLVGLILAGGVVGLVPLFMRDKGALTSSLKSVVSRATGSSAADTGIGEAQAAGAKGGAASLGSFGGKPLDRASLSGDEKLKLFEAENQVYNAIEEVLVQRYVASFFETYKAKNNLPDINAAQAAYFKDKVVVPEPEVAKFLAENKDNPGLQRIPEAERTTQVRGYLENRARSGAVRQLVDEAKAKGEIVVSVSRPVEPRLDVADGGNASFGPKDARVSIVEFADYQCPFCARMVPTLKEVVKKYDGKVRWVYRDFPLREIHPQALPAAVAANCAGVQSKYYEMHTLLFENHANLNDALYTKLAGELSLDMGKFNTCLKDPKQAEEVLADQTDGTRVGVNGTPAYFINGRKLGGAVDVREMSRVIDEELAKM